MSSVCSNNSPNDDRIWLNNRVSLAQIRDQQRNRSCYQGHGISFSVNLAFAHSPRARPTANVACEPSMLAFGINNPEVEYEDVEKEFVTADETVKEAAQLPEARQEQAEV
ncbi:hypothetical protein DL764_006621 [Monosporascus ibericus]|uniref:Uncharacterized protein n=1 Tax=Monosporascus ibericus TaxID=155417 RepID=A0A4V1XA11_9PEZI|nr:hypothetical protein DL764_006621 [Monosporascus ibericus]